jgi:hypothetical protein
MHLELAFAEIFVQWSNPPNHSALSLLAFFVKLAETGATACQAILGAGFLDVLLCMYACNFVEGSCATIGVHNIHRPGILESGSNTLTLLSPHYGIQAGVDAHPIFTLWPNKELPLSKLNSHLADRQEMWRKVGPVIVAQRLSSLGVLLQPPMIIKDYDLAEFTDAYTDLVEFSG